MNWPTIRLLVSVLTNLLQMTDVAMALIVLADRLKQLRKNSRVLVIPELLQLQTTLSAVVSNVMTSVEWGKFPWVALVRALFMSMEVSD